MLKKTRQLEELLLTLTFEESEGDSTVF